VAADLLPRFLSGLFKPRPLRSQDFETRALAAIDLPSSDLPRYQELRREGPVHSQPEGHSWLVLGYRAVREVLTDPVKFSSHPHASIDEVLLGASPPRHSQVRRVVTPILASHATGTLLHDLEEHAAELVGDRFDVVAGYAVPLTEFLGARLIGIDRATFGTILSILSHERTAPEVPRGRAWPDLRRSKFCRQLIASPEASLSEAEAVSVTGLLAMAATETTERLIVRCCVILLQRPELRATLIGNPARVAAYVEEALRLFPPEPTLLRETTRPVTLAGVTIPGGAELRLSVATANRDPVLFTEPDALRLDRRKANHLSFGGGIHQCIGAGIARRAAAAALKVLLLRAPHFTSAEPLESLSLVEVGGRLLPAAVPILAGTNETLR
jgi:cytochrome P450